AKPSSTHGTLLTSVSMNRRLRSIAEGLWNGGKLAAKRRAAALEAEEVVMAFDVSCRRKNRRVRRARRGDASGSSPCHGVPYIQTPSISERRTTRSSLRITAPGSASQRRAIVDFPAPDCPTNK